MTKLMEKAEQISKAVEACAEELLDKLCEGESKEVRDMAWSMVATRIAFRSGRGECFRLPALEEV